MFLIQKCKVIFFQPPHPHTHIRDRVDQIFTTEVFNQLEFDTEDQIFSICFLREHFAALFRAGNVRVPFAIICTTSQTHHINQVDKLEYFTFESEKEIFEIKNTNIAL